jgi:hypothetical protein
MAQRSSGYKPMRHNRYFTPPAAVGALLDAYDFGAVDAWWEPCAGAGHICAALEQMGCGPIFASDIAPLPNPDIWRGEIAKSCALLTTPPYLPLERKRVVVVTNTPYGAAGKDAMELLGALIRKVAPTGAVAALLGVGFDTRPSRNFLFREHQALVARITLTWRLRWENIKQKKSGPSGAHQWFVWDWAQVGKGLPCDAWRSEEEGIARLMLGVNARGDACRAA